MGVATRDLHLWKVNGKWKLGEPNPSKEKLLNLAKTMAENQIIKEVLADIEAGKLKSVAEAPSRKARKRPDDH